MIKKVAEYVKKWNMLEQKDRVIVGVSGGADSVCLLCVLQELRRQIGFDIVVVHINHQLRGEEALRDEKYVKELCEKEHIPCEIYYKDVELIAKNRKQSLEEAGRNARREAFWETLNKCNGTKIALAHHKNDNVETMLMNLARGTGLKGLGGMNPVTGVMIRPLLCLERSEIEEYLCSRGISYCTDQTNASNDYTRNRIRNNIIPSLEQDVNERAVTHISETMEMLRDIQQYMSEEMEKFYQNVVVEEKKSFLILKEKWNEIPSVFQGKIVQKAIATFASEEKDIQASHINSVKELMEKQTGRKVDLPYQITAKRCYEGVRFVRVEETKCEDKILGVPVDLSQDGKIRINDVILSHRTTMPELITKGKLEKTYTKCFDYDIMKSTIMIRTRMPGDYITIDQDGKTQKLKSYFINEKIPQEERDQILLLAEGSHVLWVIGYRRGYAYHIGPNTKKIIEIKIDKGEI